MSDDRAEEFAARIRAASAPVRLRGGGSKDFYGNALRGEVLDVRGHAGVIAYEPTELVVTARAGTPLAELEALLTQHGQMLAAEPPHFGADTLGGAVAAGLSGPRRAAAGSLRDFVLGVTLIDGAGRRLRFGGQVMKNVAGYDVSRLMAGSLGTLGLILDVSLKVLPRPATEATLRFELPEAEALKTMNRRAAEPLPLTASAWHDGILSLRLSGARAVVAAAAKQLGGEPLAQDHAQTYWTELRDQRAAYFAGDTPLWRLALPANAPHPELPGPTLIEWHGAQRWLRSDAPADTIRAAAAAARGHATLFRGGDKQAGVFQPLPAALAALNRRVREALDPRGMFDTGRI